MFKKLYKERLFLYIRMLYFHGHEYLLLEYEITSDVSFFYLFIYLLHIKIYWLVK